MHFLVLLILLPVVFLMLLLLPIVSQQSLALMLAHLTNHPTSAGQ